MRPFFELTDAGKGPVLVHLLQMDLFTFAISEPVARPPSLPHTLDGLRAPTEIVAMALGTVRQSKPLIPVPTEP